LNFTVNTKDFIELLKFVNPITSSNSNDLSSVINLTIRNNKLIIQATNYRTHMKGSIDVVSSTGICDIVLPFSILYQLMRNYKKKVIELKYTKQKLFIEDDKFNYNIPTNNIDFPDLLDVTQGIKLNIPENKIVDICKRLKKVIPNNPDNRALGGMNVDINKNGLINFVTTNKYRLYLYSYMYNKKIEYDKSLFDIDNSIIIPEEFINHITKSLKKSNNNIDIILSNYDIKIIKEDFVIKSQLLDASFPNYKMITDINFDHSCRLNKLDLKNALNRLKIICKFMEQDINTKRIVWDLKENKLNLSSKNNDGNEIINLIKTTDGLKTLLNYQYVLDFLTKCNSDNVKINYSSKKEPIVFNEGSNIKYFVTPSG
jgi:DNA polymerase III sliding clamp (beta) subunit (PCNA family)